MNYDDEIKERKEILNVARMNLTCETDLLTDALELRIMEQDALILEQSDSLIALRATLDGGMVELVGELVETLKAERCHHCKNETGGPVSCEGCEIFPLLTKAKEVMP